MDKNNAFDKNDTDKIEQTDQKKQVEKKEKGNKGGEENNKVSETEKKKSTKVTAVAACVLVVLLLAFFGYVQPQIIKPMHEYNRAIELLETGNIGEAEKIFRSLGDYKDSPQQIENCDIARADNSNDIKYALGIYLKYEKNPNVTKEKIKQCQEKIYQNAVAEYNDHYYESAKADFEFLNGYSDSNDYLVKCEEGIKKQQEGREKEVKEAEEKKAAENKEKMSKLVGTWYAREVYNYKDDDMTDQMGDLSQYYFTFNDDGTGICSMGERIGKKDFTWEIQEGGNGAIGVWHLNGDTETIFYYDDHILMYTYKMDSIMHDMRFFCYK